MSTPLLDTELYRPGVEGKERFEVPLGRIVKVMPPSQPKTRNT
jgi:hypothetical protein